MSENKRPIGRPHNENYTNQIKFSVDSSTAENLRILSERTSRSQADIMREILPIISSTDYDTSIPKIAMEQLQAMSDKCWETLHTPNALFPTEEISDIMPAYVVKTNPGILFVKYPTFKIEVFNGKNPLEPPNENILNKVLKEINGKWFLSERRIDYIIDGTEICLPSFPYVKEIICLYCDLNSNIRKKDEIISKLQNNGFAINVYPSYCLRRQSVTLYEGGKYFRICSEE